MREESTARPSSRLKSSGPDMKASFPGHDRTAYSVRFIENVLSKFQLTYLY
jgi:hypothetical protein